MGIINNENRKVLLGNPNVESLSEKHITYTSEFIQDALKLYSDGNTACTIWEKAGFDLDYFKRDYFRNCLNRWKSQIIDGVPAPKTRGAKRSEFASLEEENAYLKAELSLVKELRALGVEGRITGSVLSLELFRTMKNSQLPISVESVILAKQGITDGLIDL